MEKIAFNSNGLGKEQIIEFNKMISEMRKNARSHAKHGQCLLCGKEVDGFCNSHTIPQMCLKNIDTNGIVGSIFSIVENDIVNRDSGVKNAGVFHNICHECDNTVFQTYESPRSYTGEISTNFELLNQIALKNSLRDIYKHEIELEFLKQLPSEAKKRNGGLWAELYAKMTSDTMIRARKIDIEECNSELNKCKKYMNSKEPWLKVITCELLDYRVPVAYQGMVALITGFDGEIINDKYSYKEGYQLEYIHIAILPFDSSSVILLFTDQANTRYDRFIKRMNCYPKTKQIQVINYILFLCCENYYVSKTISTKTLGKIKEVASLIEESISINKTESLKKSIIECDLKKAWSQTNILGIHV